MAKFIDIKNQGVGSIMGNKWLVKVVLFSFSFSSLLYVCMCYEICNNYGSFPMIFL